jgi:hypothetical protein
MLASLHAGEVRSMYRFGTLTAPEAAQDEIKGNVSRTTGVRQSDIDAVVNEGRGPMGCRNR